MFGTTIIEVLLFVAMNFSIFRDIDQFCEDQTFVHDFVEAGWPCRATAISFDVLALFNCLAFTYFISVAYEYYAMATENPTLIDREY